MILRPRNAKIPLSPLGKVIQLPPVSSLPQNTTQWISQFSQPSMQPYDGSYSSVQNFWGVPQTYLEKAVLGDRVIPHNKEIKGKLTRSH